MATINAANTVKDKIMQGFIELYSKQGSDKLTVGEICRQAGCNRTTFYNYYRDIRDLLEQSQDEVIADLRLLIPLLLRGLTEGGQAAEEAEIKEVMGQSYDYLPLLLQRGEWQFNRQLKLIFREELIKATGKRPISSLDEYNLQAVIASQLGLLDLWLERGKDIPFAQLIAIMQDSLSAKDAVKAAPVSGEAKVQAVAAPAAAPATKQEPEAAAASEKKPPFSYIMSGRL